MNDIQKFLTRLSGDALVAIEDRQFDKANALANLITASALMVIAERLEAIKLCMEAQEDRNANLSRFSS